MWSYLDECLDTTLGNLSVGWVWGNFPGGIRFSRKTCSGDVCWELSEVGVRIPIQDYMSLRVAVVIQATKVNTQIHTDTDRQLVTGYTLYAHPAELKPLSNKNKTTDINRSVRCRWSFVVGCVASWRRALRTRHSPAAAAAWTPRPGDGSLALTRRYTPAPTPSLKRQSTDTCKFCNVQIICSRAEKKISQILLLLQSGKHLHH